MKINDGGPAFPRQAKQVDNPDCFRADELCAQSGMSLRDFFAAAILSNAQLVADDPRHAARVAQTCWEYADAMIKERCSDERDTR